MTDILPTVEIAEILLAVAVANYLPIATLADILLMTTMADVLSTIVMVDIPQQTAGQADFSFRVIPCRQRVPTASKRTPLHLLVRSPLLSNFFSKDFGRIFSWLIRIARGVSLYTDCVSYGAS